MKLIINQKANYKPVLTGNYTGGMLLRRHMPTRPQKTVGGLLVATERKKGQSQPKRYGSMYLRMSKSN